MPWSIDQVPMQLVSTAFFLHFVCHNCFAATLSTTTLDTFKGALGPELAAQVASQCRLIGYDRAALRQVPQQPGKINQPNSLNT
jgi:hypothetical protein